MTRVIDTYELSPMQAGMLFHAVSAGYSGVYVEQVVATLREPLDETVFLRAYQRVVERHPILRSRFRWESVAEPVQDVVDQVQIPVERFDWRAFAETERRQRFQALLDHERTRGFDLAQAPLMRFAIVRAAEREHLMLWTFHHLLLDGGSSLVLREVFTFYEAFLRGADVDLPLPRPYRDYIEWLRKLDHDCAKPYWQDALSGFRAPTPLVVARDREAEQVAGSDRGSHEIRLSAELTTALKQRAREASVTLNILLQGIWALLLHRYSGETDIVFGAVRGCRRSTVSGAHQMLGPFVNTLPMRVRIDPETAFVQLLQQLRAQHVVLREYEQTPLVKIQGWSDVPRGTPLFESIFMFENQTLDAYLRALGGAWNERHFQYLGQTNYPLAVNAYGGPELLLQLVYSRRRFAGNVVARMLGHLQTMLEAVAADSRARLKDLPLLTEAERHQLLLEWNATGTDYPADALIHELFAVQANRTPEAVAVVFEGQSLTYRELDARTNQLARCLQNRGVGPDTLVALCVERSLEMVVGILGILKAGGAYVPIDPDYPPQRIAYMLEEVQSPLVLTQRRLHAQLPLARERSIYLDTDWPAIAQERSSPVSSAVTASNIAYVMYTSGSTGHPKGIMIPHAGICNLMFWTQRVYPLGDADVVLQKTSFGFDASVWEFFAPLQAGAKLVMARPGGHLDLAYLTKTILAHGVSILKVVPSQLRLLLEDETFCRCAPPLRHIYCAGEPLTRDLCETFSMKLPRAALHNLYGPTETSVDATYWDCPGGGCDVVPIGRPVDNTRTYVVDPRMQLCPIGVPGELLVGGVGLARGYLNKPELNAEKFIPDPFSATPGARLYKTGDRVRYLPDGNIEFLGRIDNQVKIRGYRVELGEIEAVLAEHPEVRQAAVHLWTSKPDDIRIVACCVLAKAGVLAPNTLRKHLRSRLPEYMIPQYFLPVEEIPLTPNGKIDRSKLPTPAIAESGVSQHEAPADPVEVAIAEIWTKLIHPARPIDRNDRFFEMGGHSLLGLRALGQMEQELGVKLDFRALFQESLADIATRCRSQRIAQSAGDSGVARTVPLHAATGPRDRAI